MENYYTLLNIDINASHEDIKKSYRKLSLIHHPDKNGGEDTIFKKINEAYSTLSDNNKKREYDISIGQNQGTTFRRQNSVNIDDIFNDIFFRKTNDNPHHMFMNNPFENIFHMNTMPEGNRGNIRIFHNGIHISPPQYIEKPEIIVKNISVNIKNIIEDNIINIEIERWIFRNNIKEIEKEVLYVNIPKGIDNNEIIILKDKGHIYNEIIRGDIKLVIEIINDTEYKRNGLDLVYTKNITLKDSLCGFSFDLKHINGKSYTLNNTPGNIIIPGYKKILPELGLSRETFKGNLIIIFNLIFPEYLELDIIEKLKDIL